MTYPLTPQGRFDYAINNVLKHEGGYADHENDPGGPTNFGISLTFLKSILPDSTTDDIKNLSIDDAKDIYKKYWWDKYHYEAINSLPLATKIFDMSVNMGAKESHEIVQRICNLYNNKLEIDGILGTNTIATLNEICLHGDEEELINKIVKNQVLFYVALVNKNPKLKIFLQGWLNRAADQDS